jgi:TPR repeat protein
MLKSISLILFVLVLNLFAQNEALEAYKQKDYKKAFQLYKADAKKGNTTAQNALSYLYFNGIGTDKDNKKGLYWLEKAAEKNDSRAQYDLAMMYFDGYNIKQNHKKAFKWLSKSSDLNNTKAKYNLALMYYNGDSTDMNVTKTAVLLDEIALKGHKLAKENVGRIYMQLLKFDKAIYWLKQNAKNNDKEAYYLLAEIYCSQGKYKEAKPWAKKAMDSGNLTAKELWDKYKLKNF